MKKIYLLAFVSLVLQSLSRVVCFPILAVLGVENFAKNDMEVYSFVFVLGLLSDIVSGRFMGETSIFLLVLTFFLQFLKLKFNVSPKINLGVLLLFEIVYFVLVNWFSF